MAAQPDRKRWWGEHPLLNTFLGAVLATALAWWFLRPEPPPPPPAPTTSSVPTSDRAAILVDWPCPLGGSENDNDIHVAGSGWHADTEVEIELPEQLGYYTLRALVSNGSFSDRRHKVRRPEDYQPLDVFVVTVRGLQSGKQLTEERHTPSAGC